MKNKGFTLIELLAVILIIGLIATIATPAILSAINTSKDKSYQKQIELVENAAKRWAVDNKIGATCTVSLGTLKTDGYLDKDIENPKDKTKMYGNVDINVETIKGENDQITYKYTYKYTEVEKAEVEKEGTCNQNT